jgi:F-type H+-transporting ATPase subunit epsilon
MTKPLRLTVLTPAETLLDVAEAAWVQVQLSDGGGIGIYPGHAPLLAETVAAPVRYADESGEHALDLEAGILQVELDGVTIFTSGLAQTSEDFGELSRAVSETSEVSDGARFDRLARALFTTLRTRPEEASILDRLRGSVLNSSRAGSKGAVESLDIDDEEE